MFLTFLARPGYNISLLRRFGFNSEFALFRGNHLLINDTININWGNASDTIQGDLLLKVKNRIKNIFSLFQGTLKKTKYNLSGLFQYGNLEYYSGHGESRKLKSKNFGLKDFQLKTPGINYPSDKLSLDITNLTKFKRMRWFDMYFKLNGKYDIEILLEDSKRNFHPPVF